MNITTIRLRYSRILVIGFLAVFLYTMTQSLSGGIPQFEKHLWGRKFLVSSFTEIRLKLGDRVFLQALVGKDGWLDYTGKKNLDGYQNVIKTPPGAWKKTQQKLQRLYEELQKRNITFILVIPPNKATIYPDKLPDEIRKINPQSKLDTFADYLQQHGPPILVDLRPALQEGRKKQDVYYQTNTHWNRYGAFIGYTEVMKELSKTYPQLTPKSIDDFVISTRQPVAHDIARIIGATNLLESGMIFIPKEQDNTPKENLPTLLMYMDSFGTGMKDFISPHFRKTTFIALTLNPNLLSLKRIDTTKPNIVILEIVERSFNTQNLDRIISQFLRQK